MTSQSENVSWGAEVSLAGSPLRSLPNIFPGWLCLPFGGGSYAEPD
jgi:hypothetical protein